jgi:hypothetical protein
MLNSAAERGLAEQSGWTLAEFAGGATSDGMQRRLNAAVWDEDGIRDPADRVRGGRAGRSRRAADRRSDRTHEARRRARIAGPAPRLAAPVVRAGIEGERLYDWALADARDGRLLVRGRRPAAS